MNFYQKKRRTPVLQIISMIDILIILLIFLVVSTTFKDPQKQKATAAARSVLNVSIPVSDAMNLGTDTASRVSLTVSKDDRCFLADVEVPLPQLAGSLRVFKESSTAKLDLRLDEKVPFGTVIKIWDALTKAGYQVGDVPARVSRGAGAAQ